MKRRRRWKPRRISAWIGAAVAALFVDPVAEALWPWCSRDWRIVRIGGAL